MHIIMFVVMLFSAQQNLIPSHENSHAWKKIEKFYMERRSKNIKYIIEHGKKNNAYIASILTKYNKGYQFDIKPNVLDKYSCSFGSGESGNDVVYRIICLLIKAKAMILSGNDKYYYLYDSMAKNAYERHKKAVDAYFNTNGSMSGTWLDLPLPKVIRRWPETRVSVRKNWDHVAVDNGHVNAFIDGRRIDMELDTGTTGITFSEKFIESNHLWGYFHSLHVNSNLFDGLGGLASNVYYVKRFDVGPIEIDNAYVYVTKKGGSFIGIDILARLGAFAYGEHAISRISSKNIVSCYMMDFTRHKYHNSAIYPFMSMDTDMGKLGLYFDSHELSSGPVKNVSIFISKKSFYRENGKPHKSPVKTIPVSLTSNGRTVWADMPIYDVKVSGERLRMLLSPEEFDDSFVMGSIGYRILDKFSIVYDFDNRKMCLTLPQD